MIHPINGVTLEIKWTKPLTPCGPDSDPNNKLLGTVEINGIPFHAEAYEVTGGSYQRATNPDTWCDEILEIVQGAAQTIDIEGAEYVLAITPYQL